MSKRARADDGPEDEPDQTTIRKETIECTIPPCFKNPPKFSNYSEYELHIINTHTYICQACKRKFPSGGILSLHIEENHDPFFIINRERGNKVYKCLNYSEPNGCKKVCSDRKKRRLHMIDKHGYPREFDFGIIDRGIEKCIY